MSNVRGQRVGHGGGQRGGQGGGQRGGADNAPRGRGRGEGMAQGFEGSSARGRGFSQSPAPGRGRGGFPAQGGPPAPGQSTQMASHVPQGKPGIFSEEKDQRGLEKLLPPDANVLRKEDTLVKTTKGKIIEKFQGRNSFGTKGKPITLRTNYFAIEPIKDMTAVFWRYDINVQPEVSRAKLRQAVTQLLQEDIFQKIETATDYSKILVTNKQLDLGKTEDWSTKITIEPPENTGSPSQAPEPAEPIPEFVQKAKERNTVTVTVKFVSTYSLAETVEWLNSESSGGEYAGSSSVIQLLNIIIPRKPAQNNAITKVGGTKYYPSGAHPGSVWIPLGGGLIAQRGYFVSVRPAVNRLLLNVNVVSGAFYSPVNLDDLVQDYIKANTADKDDIESFIRLLKVSVAYKKHKGAEPWMTKQKTICGFAKPVGTTVKVKRFGNAKEVTFAFTDHTKPNAKEQQISVFDYFRQHHGIVLEKPDRPVLNVGTRADPQYVPIELCTVVAGQPFKRLLSGEQTSSMITFAARAPNLNAESIRDLGLRIFWLKDPAKPWVQQTSVNPWGFGIKTEMLTVPGRILNAPSILYGGDRAAQVRNGAWNLANVKFQRGGRFGSWAAIMIHNGQRQRAMNENPYGDALGPEDTFKELAFQLQKYNVTMGPRQATHQIMLDGTSREFRDATNKRLVNVFQLASRGKISMLFIVLTSADRWLYSRIKYYGDVEFGIHTICSVGKNLQKPNGRDMYMGNLALKFNVKGGGVSHTVTNTLLNPVGKNTMVFGIDVTHPSPGSTKGAPSIACVVANTDEFLFQWPGSIRPQQGRVEMVSELKEMVKERMQLWIKRNKRLPENVVIYRDGVSEGEFVQVLEKEYPAFTDAYKELYGPKDKKPKTTVIIVGKRHHTRFYPTDIKDADYNASKGRGSMNPQAGTVVDRCISNKVWHEFWLQAHQGLQGTARPAHYTVLRDEIGFSADQLEQFTHNLSYHFVRCTKAVSRCPPAYYADILAERGRAYLYSALQENHHGGSESGTYDGSKAEWRGGVHPNLCESTWYI